jgi:predicted extracellular nuclease
VRAPENCGAACAPIDPCPPGADGITDITLIQKPDAPCENRTVKVRGVVTGIDDLYGSNFNFVFRSDSGIWVQQATRPQGATSSSGIFIAGISRDADRPESVIGSDVTINGRVETKFGLVQIVPPGVGQTNQNAQLVDLTTTPTAVGLINSTNNPLPEPVTLDRVQSETQGVATRDYYRSLQGMRVRLPEGIATGGGTTKFRDVFVEPGTTATRLFRKNDLAAITTPWSDARAELGISGEAGAGNPEDPRIPWHSSTQVDLDLFDVVRDVVGPLTFSFSYYKVMPQPGGPAPAIERGPIHAAAPPTAPPTPADSLRVASFNVENGAPPRGGAPVPARPARAQARAGRSAAAARAPARAPPRRGPGRQATGRRARPGNGHRRARLAAWRSPSSRRRCRCSWSAPGPRS